MLSHPRRSNSARASAMVAGSPASFPPSSSFQSSGAQEKLLRRSAAMESSWPKGTGTFLSSWPHISASLASEQEPSRSSMGSRNVTPLPLPVRSMDVMALPLLWTLSDAPLLFAATASTVVRAG